MGLLKLKIFFIALILFFNSIHLNFFSTSIPYFIYIFLIIIFSVSKNKVKFIISLFFVISFWYIFINYVNFTINYISLNSNYFVEGLLSFLHIVDQKDLSSFLMSLAKYSNHFNFCLINIMLISLHASINSFDFFNVDDILNMFKKLNIDLQNINLHGTGGGGPDPNPPHFENVMLLIDKMSHYFESKAGNLSAFTKREILDKLPRAVNFGFLDNVLKIVDGNIFLNTSLKFPGDFNFFSSVAELESKILSSNAQIIPFDTVKYSIEYAYIKEFYHFHCIERNIFSYISPGLLINYPMIDITPNIFLKEVYLNLDSYLYELDRLLMAKEWCETVLLKLPNTVASNLTGEFAVKCEKAYELYRLRQIYFFNVNISDDCFGGNRYIANMIDHKEVYKELLENILYVKLQILESD